MLILECLVQRDFFFNGHWLSEFEGDIGGASTKPLNMLPQKEIIAEPVLGLDGEVFIKSRFQPRRFTIPVKFENMKRIREISSWLGVKEPSDFYYKGDKVKIKVLIDNLLDVELYAYEGLVELSFTAYDPYFKAIDDIIFTCIKPNVYEPPINLYNAIEIIDNEFNLIKITDTDRIPSNVVYYPNSYLIKNQNNIIINRQILQQIEIYNDGNSESYPLYKIKGKGIITVGVNGNETFRIKLDSTGNDYMYIDTYNCTCYNSNINRFNDFEGSFKSVNDKKIIYGIIGECTEFEINCRSRWI